MDITALQFAIVCPLIFLAGFVDAVAGGGGLISLPAYMLVGLPVHMAIGTNKLSSGMGTALTTWRFSRSDYIPWRQAGLCVACALLGSSAGANLALLISDGFFRVLMLFILPLAAVAHMDLRSANGVAKVINLTTNLTALAVYLLNGKVIFVLGLAAGCFSLAGNYIGTRFFDRGGAKAVKPLMLAVLTLFFVKICWEFLA